MNKRIISERAEQEILKSPEYQESEKNRFMGVFSGLLALDVARNCIMYFSESDNTNTSFTQSILTEGALFVASIGIAKGYARFRTLREFDEKYIVFRPVREKQTTAEWCEKAFAHRELASDIAPVIEIHEPAKNVDSSMRSHPSNS